MKIIPLSEGSFTVDKTKHFVPFDSAEHELYQRPTGSLLVEIQPFVIITSKDILMLDTGLGFEYEGRLQIHNNLSSAGLTPGNITKVFLSHLHKDHSGGIAMGSAQESLSFPNAVYYVQDRELRNATEKNSSSYIKKDFDLLNHSSQVIRLSANEGIIDDYITYQVTGAHSPYHQVFFIEEKGEKIFFGGDDAPQLQQMKHRFIAKYDHDGRKASELRKLWWEKGNEENWIFLFYHDIRSPVYQHSEKKKIPVL